MTLIESKRLFQASSVTSQAKPPPSAWLSTLFFQTPIEHITQHQTLNGFSRSKGQSPPTILPRTHNQVHHSNTPWSWCQLLLQDYHHCDEAPWPKQLRGHRVHLVCSHCSSLKDMRTGPQAPEDGSRCRDHGEVLATGLLLLAGSACFLTELKIQLLTQ